MRRLGRLLLWLLALLFLAASLALIIEGAHPGVSRLFAWAERLDPQGLPPAARPFATPAALFEIATWTHILLGSLAAWWIVITCLLRGTRQGLRGLRWLIPLAILAALQILLTPLTSSPLLLSQDRQTTVASLGIPEQMAPALYRLASPYLNWTLLLILSYCAAATLLARTTAERRITRMITVLGLITLAGFVVLWVRTPPSLTDIDLTLFQGLGLVAFSAFLLSDDDRAGAPHILVGAAATVAAVIFVSIQAASGLFSVETTLSGSSGAYLAPYAMVAFLGFALLDQRWSPRLPRLVIWLHAAGLAVIIGLAFVPLTDDALASLQPELFDYSADFTPARFAIANAQLLLLVWVLGGIAIMNRYRDRPHPQAPHTKDATQLAA